MKTNIRRLALALGFALVPLWIFAQGSLTPPGAPAPTMKTLDQIEPRTPISSIPFTASQPGSYYLTKNLTMTGDGDGITISSDNVTIDLNGFTLDGANLGNSGISTHSAAFTYYHCLHVLNGNSKNWIVRGFNLENCYSGVLENLQAHNNSVGIYCSYSVVKCCNTSYNTATGVNALDSNIRDCNAEYNPVNFYLSSCTITECRASNANDIGITAIVSTVSNCVLDQDHYGIVSNKSSNIHHNQIAYCVSDGIRLLGGNSLVADNNVTYAGSSGTGIWCQSDYNRIVRNNVTGCTNGGIGVSGSFNTIDGDSVLGNGRGTANIGISVAGSKNTVVRNISLGNGYPINNYSIATGNNAGPIDAANNSTNSWSNTQ